MSIRENAYVVDLPVCPHCVLLCSGETASWLEVVKKKVCRGSRLLGKTEE